MSTIPSSPLCTSKRPKLFSPSYMTDKFLPPFTSAFTCNRFIHPDDGGHMFLWNTVTNKGFIMLCSVHQHNHFIIQGKWLQHREQHGYKTTHDTVIKYLVRSTYTHAEEDFWPHGLQKQRSQQLDTYFKRKPVTEGLPIHSIHKSRYKREVLPDSTIQPFDTTPPPRNRK